MGVDALRPLGCDGQVVLAVDGDLCYAAGDAVEACGEDYDVELTLGAVGRFDAGFGEGCDGIGAQIDQCHIGLVEGFEVPLFQADSLCAEGMRFGRGRENRGVFGRVDAW